MRREAIECLRAGMTYSANPAVRIAAIEAIVSSPNDSMLPWLRTALLDEVPAVRFAACVALGTLKDKVSEAKLHDLLHDEDRNVRLAAIYALHRLGRSAHTGELSTYLLTSENVVERRHAAMLLGLIGEQSGVKLLAGAMRDPDAGVRQHCLEAMARIGVRDAKQELAFLANSGVGADEVFALRALAIAKDPSFEETFRFKLSNAAHTETKLAAAWGLGELGSDDGFAFTLATWNAPPTPRADPKDAPADQTLRIRLLAAGALGAIGRNEALEPLTRVLREERDPRIRIATAQAVLRIVGANAGANWPLGKQGK